MSKRNRVNVSTADILTDNLDAVLSGVEVGVWKAGLSSHLLRVFPQLSLYMVDQWKSFPPDSEYYRTTHMGKNDDIAFEQVRQTALAAVAFAGLRAIPIQSTSRDAAVVVPLELDFVFLDAGHTKVEVEEDLTLWSPHVRSGGIVMGHDYNGVGDRRKRWGVKRAVDEFCAKQNWTVTEAPCLLWWTKKP